MRRYPFGFHIALDGNGINGLEGRTGVCLFLFDPADDAFGYKIAYFDGIAGGHAVSVNPSGSVGFLGNSGQHLLFYDARTLEEVGRVSNLRFEVNDTSLRGTTHVVWLSDHEVVAPVGDYFYRFDLERLEHPERLRPHGVKLPHAMRRTASGRYVCYGSMDHPVRGEAREVGIWDTRTDEVRRVELPATCWHLTSHPTRDLFYAVSFRVLPTGGRDYHQWAMAFFKEYVFEIDAATGTVERHWAAGREIPAHINSDVTISGEELIFCNGASQTIVCVELGSLRRHRVIDERPDLATSARAGRQMATQVYDVLSRGGFFQDSRDLFAALRVSRFTLVDSVHACQLAPGGELLFTANRGLNHVTIYDYPECRVRLRVPMPDLHHYFPEMPWIADPRLGFHHGYVVGPDRRPKVQAVEAGGDRSRDLTSKTNDPRPT